MPDYAPPEILDALDPTPTLLVEVLTTVVKPIFQRNPHPYLNIETGRKLPRPAGGAGATLDVYDVQDWKGHPTVVCTLRWCARRSPVRILACVLIQPTLRSFPRPAHGRSSGTY
jgi:hypothetical protein